MEMNIFNKYSLPNQFIFAGNDYLYITQKDKSKYITNNVNYKSLSTFDNNNYPDEEISKIRLLLNSNPTGIVLNSSFFVFNILKFEKIPFNKKKLSSIVNWRIEKIFPEDQSLYIHQFYILNTEYILSVLIRKETKKSIDNFFFKLGVKQAYFGSSTIELINLLYGSSNPLKSLTSSKKPDFFIELWGNSATIVFQNKLTPFYIRKFIFLNKEELESEIEKTVKYIKSSYSLLPKSYCLFKNNSDIEGKDIHRDLSKSGLIKIDIENKFSRFIKGVSL